jgi:hypothetical protein
MCLYLLLVFLISNYWRKQNQDNYQNKEGYGDKEE